MINGYLNALKLIFFPFIGTREAFLKCKGQIFKTAVLRSVIDRNYAYSDRIGAIIGVVGLRCEIAPVLLDVAGTGTGWLHLFNLVDTIMNKLFLLYIELWCAVFL